MLYYVSAAYELNVQIITSYYHSVVSNIDYFGHLYHADNLVDYFY